MAEFVIRVADERGKVLEKAEAGYSAAEIRERYQQSGYLVYWVKPRSLISGGKIRLPQRRHVTLEQFVIFNQQFLTLVRAGLPIVQALELLAKRQRNQYFRSCWRTYATAPRAENSSLRPSKNRGRFQRSIRPR